MRRGPICTGWAFGLLGAVPLWCGMFALCHTLALLVRSTAVWMAGYYVAFFIGQPILTVLAAGFFGGNMAAWPFRLLQAVLIPCTLLISGLPSGWISGEYLLWCWGVGLGWLAVSAARACCSSGGWTCASGKEAEKDLFRPAAAAPSRRRAFQAAESKFAAAVPITKCLPAILREIEVKGTRSRAGSLGSLLIQKRRARACRQSGNARPPALRRALGMESGGNLRCGSCA